MKWIKNISFEDVERLLFCFMSMVTILAVIFADSYRTAVVIFIVYAITMFYFKFQDLVKYYRINTNLTHYFRLDTKIRGNSEESSE